MPDPFSFTDYAERVSDTLKTVDWTHLEILANELLSCWKRRSKVFLCGNGGSAANAMHLANDFLYGINPEGPGLRVISLADNASILTCLANDTGYENIYAHQLKTLAEKDDVLIAFSGSGNSPNIVQAIEIGKSMEMHTVAVLGYEGGKCKELVDTCIHFEIKDMQIAEDMQQMVGHMLTRWLRSNLSIQAAC